MTRWAPLKLIAFITISAKLRNYGELNCDYVPNILNAGNFVSFEREINAVRKKISILVEYNSITVTYVIR